LGASHPEVAMAFRQLGMLYRYDGWLDQAEEAFCKALAVQDKAPELEYPEVAKRLDDLAGAPRRAGRGKEAHVLQARTAAMKAKAAGLKSAAGPQAPVSGR